MKKFFAVLIALVLAGAAVYFLSKNSEQVILNSGQSSPPPPTAPSTQANSLDWKSMLPELTTLLQASFTDVRIGEQYPIRIDRTIDITGDGLPEAFVDIGAGGAYTDEYALVMLQDGKPVVPKFKQQDGTVGSLWFSQGASVMNSESVGFVASAHAIYSLSQDAGACDVEAYQWNAGSRMFLYSAPLGSQIRKEKCATTK